MMQDTTVLLCYFCLLRPDKCFRYCWSDTNDNSSALLYILNIIFVSSLQELTIIWLLRLILITFSELPAKMVIVCRLSRSITLKDRLFAWNWFSFFTSFLLSITKQVFESAGAVMLWYTEYRNSFTHKIIPIYAKALRTEKDTKGRVRAPMCVGGIE